MPDISLKSSSQYWSEYSDPMIYRVITFMESVEDWTLDGDKNLEAALDILGKEMDNLENVDLGRLAEEEKFIRIAGNIKTGRGLRILQALDTVHPGSASRILIHAEENTMSPNDPSGFFLARNLIFERLRLLGRVFAKERFELVLRALEGEE